MMKEKFLSTLIRFKLHLFKIAKRHGIKKYLHDRELYRFDRDLDPREASHIIDFFIAPEIASNELRLRSLYPAFNSFDYENSNLFDHSQPWIGLNPETLQTPYSSFLELFEYIEKNYEIKKMIDVGAAYGRAAFVKNTVFKDVEYIGYEIVPERARIACGLFAKYRLENCSMYEGSVFDQDLPSADLYILYDFSNKNDIYRFLTTLENAHKDGTDYLIAAEGANTLEVIQSYFDQLYVIQSPLPNHGRWNIYASTDDFRIV